MPQELPPIQHWHSQDIDELSGLLNGWEQEFRQLSCGAFSGEVCSVRGEHMAIAAERTNQSLHESVAPPAGCLVFGLVLNRDDALQVNRRAVSTSSLIVLEGGSEYDFRTDGETELLGLLLERRLFDEHATAGCLAVLKNAIARHVVPLDQSATTMLRQFWLMISRMLASDGHWPGSAPLDLLADSAMNNILLALAMSQSVATPALPPDADREARVVRLAIAYMRRHLDRDISVADICAATHVSRRTLQYHFDHCLHMSPLQYLKVLRLDAARRILRARGAGHPIAEIAAQCGYDHPSRFAGDYKRQFGVLPSEVRRTDAGVAVVA